MRPKGRAVWLWCWLGVLVASCGQGTLPSPTSRISTLALWGFTPIPTTPSPPLRLLRTPTLRATNMVLLTRLPTPLPLLLPPPNCYETPVGSLWCLGQVRNNLLTSVTQVSVRLYLVTADGSALSSRDVAIVRSSLSPGEGSPYGVLFDSVPDKMAGPVAVLISANPQNRQITAISLQIQNAQSQRQESAFHVTGEVVNPGKTRVQQISVVVTLFDARERVTGFRQLRWPDTQGLAPGDHLPFTLDVTPQSLGTVRFEASAEGLVS